MFRERMIVIALLAVGLAAAACAPSSVEEDVAALSERIETLEKQVQTLQSSGGSTANLEAEAKAAYANVTQLVAAGKYDDAKKQFRSYGTKFAGTPTGRRLQSLGSELAVIGKDCPPNWGIEKWYQGQNAIDLDGGATTVLVFWETWCPHCRREVPKLQEMYDKFKGDGLQLIGLTRLNRKQPESEVTDLIAQNNVSYPMAKENGALAKYFAVAGIPAAAVVKDGKIVWRGHPSRITDGMIQNWLAS